MRIRFLPALLISLILISPPLPARAESAGDIVNACFNYMRGKASYSITKMVIHRPDWQRSMTIRAWTRGTEDSMFRITEPAKDQGNGTLKKGRQMWMYNPKVNRVIKLPPSMMSQAWMGSDFSNNDLAKSDSMIKDYVHSLEGTETHEGKKVYVIKSMPKPEAPVVWGMMKLKIREDHIMLGQAFFDDELKPVKAMVLLDIKPIGGKLYPMKWRMAKNDVKDEYTLVEYRELKFMDSVPARYFSLSFLKTPGR